MAAMSKAQLQPSWIIQFFPAELYDLLIGNPISTLIIPVQGEDVIISMTASKNLLGSIDGNIYFLR